MRFFWIAMLIGILFISGLFLYSIVFPTTEAEYKSNTKTFISTLEGTKGQALTLQPVNVSGQKYPDLVVKNGANTILTLKLQENTDDCLMSCYAIINVTNAIAGALPNSFDFKDSKGAMKTRPYNTYFFNNTRTKLNQHYVCNYSNVTTLNVFQNSTYRNITNQLCNPRNDYNFTTPDYFWQPYSGQTFPIGNHLLKIEGNKQANESLDWGFNYGGLLGDDIRQYWAWWNSSFSYRKALNVTGGSALLTDFTVFVNVSYATGMQTDFDDVRFANGSCGNEDAELKYELDSKTDSTVANYWIKIPALASGVNQICMYYGSASASSASDGVNAWDSDYFAVWHLNDLTDSKQRNNLTTNTTLTYVSGIIGNALNVTQGNWAFASDSPDFAIGSGKTIEVWGLPHGIASRTLMGQSTGYASNNRWLIYPESNVMKFNIYSGSEYRALSTNPVIVNTWQFYNAYRSGTTHWMGINQTGFGSYTQAGTFDFTDNFCLGRNCYAGESATYWWSGLIDEVRISNVSRSSVWMNRSYSNKDTSLFTFGAEESAEVIFVNITFVRQLPGDLTSTNLAGNPLNITYIINTTNASASIVLSTVKLYWLSNGSTHTDYTWIVNGSIIQTGFRTTDVVISNITHLYNFTLSDNLYPANYMLNTSDYEYGTHTAQTTILDNDNEMLKVTILNMSNNTVYNFMEYMIENQTAASASLRIYYCNSTYTSGVTSLAANCGIFANILASQTYSHQENQSKHWIASMPINTSAGTLAGIKITNNGSFIFRGRTTDGWTAYTIAKDARTGATQTSTNTGTNWNTQTYALDFHFHQFAADDAFNYYVCANDTGGYSNCSAQRRDTFNNTDLPPSSPNVFVPTNSTYEYLVPINYTAAVSPNGYAISYYNISLHYSNDSFYKAITTNNSQQLNYTWDSTTTPNGYYNIHVRATDTTGQNSFGESEVFELYNAKPSFGSVTLNPTNGSYYLNNRNYSISINITSTNQTAILTFNNINYTMSLLSGDTYTYNISNLGAGTYPYYFYSYSNGTARLTNISNISYYTVQQSSAALVLTYLNGTADDITIYNGTTINITSTLTTGIGDIDLYINGTKVNSGQSPLYNLTTFSIPGTYLIITNYSGNQNFTKEFDDLYVYVILSNISTVTTLSVSPASPITYGTASNFSCSADVAGLVQYLDIDGVNKTSELGLNIVRGVGTYSLNCSTPTQSYYLASSDTETYIINKSSPTITISFSPSSSVVVGNPSSVSCSAPEGSVSLYRNGTLVSNPDVQTLALGTYEYTCYYTATQNYTVGSTASNLNIVPLPPAATSGIINFTSSNLSQILYFQVPYNFVTQAYVNFSGSNETGASGVTYSKDTFGNSSVIYVNYTLFGTYNNNSIIYSYTGANLISGTYETNFSITDVCINGSTVFIKAYISALNPTSVKCLDNSGGETTLGNAGIGITSNKISYNTSGTYPSNLNVSISNRQIYYYPGAFNQSQNRTQNFYAQINPYLETCTFVGGYCYVPFNFTSVAVGLLIYNTTYFNNSGFIEHSQTYTTPVYVGTSQIYTINISYDVSNYPSVVPYFYYAGTTPTTTVATLTSSSGNNAIYRIVRTTDITAGTYSFNWTMQMTDTNNIVTDYNSSTNSQIVAGALIDNCTNGTRRVFNYTAYDEDLLTKLTTDIEVLIKVYSLDRSSLIATYNKSYPAVSSVSICMDDAVTNSSGYVADYQVKYGNTTQGYFIEYMNGQNITLNNATIPWNITLYDLLTGSNQAYKVIFRDSYLSPVSDYVIQLQRQYVAANVFREVESPVTDVNGIVVLHPISDDVLYNIIAMKNNQIIASYPNVYFTCDTTLCTISLNEISAPVTAESYTTYTNLNYLFTFNNNTRTLQVSFSTTDGNTNNVSWNVITADAYENNTICSNSQVASAGAFTCVVPTTYGNTTIRASIYNRGTLSGVYTQSTERKGSEIFGGTRLLLGMLMYTTLVLLFISNPVAIIIGAMLGMIFIYLFLLADGGSLVGIGATAMWFFIAGGIILWQIHRVAR